MIISKLLNLSYMYSNHYSIIKFVDFEPIYYVVNVVIVSSYIVQALQIKKNGEWIPIRATPTRVAIRGVIPITAKMIPQRQKIRFQWRWQNIIKSFGVTYLATLEREWRGCKIAVGGYCSSQRLYYIPYLANLIIFFNKKH